MFILFILCLFVVVVVVVVGANVSKYEVNFQGARKDVNLKQWPLNHLSKVGEYMNGYLLSYLFTLFNAPFCVNTPQFIGKETRSCIHKIYFKTKETKVHTLTYTAELTTVYKVAKRQPTTQSSPVSSSRQSEMTSNQPRGER